MNSAYHQITFQAFGIPYLDDQQFWRKLSKNGNEFKIIQKTYNAFKYDGPVLDKLLDKVPNPYESVQTKNYDIWHEGVLYAKKFAFSLHLNLGNVSKKIAT